MMSLALLVPRQGNPPPVWFILLMPMAFLGISWLTSRVMGIGQMYRDWPADLDDPIEQNLGWQQVEFGGLKGHTPMSLKLGRRCLHIKQPFPFMPAFWQGPASVPWREVILVRAPRESWWSFLSLAEFTLGKGGRVIRLRGKAGRTLAARVSAGTAPAGHAPMPPVDSGAIRPR